MSRKYPKIVENGNWKKFAPELIARVKNAPPCARKSIKSDVASIDGAMQMYVDTEEGGEWNCDLEDAVALLAEVYGVDLEKMRNRIELAAKIS